MIDAMPPEAATDFVKAHDVPKNFPTVWACPAVGLAAGSARALGWQLGTRVRWHATHRPHKSNALTLAQVESLAFPDGRPEAGADGTAADTQPTTIKNSLGLPMEVVYQTGAPWVGGLQRGSGDSGQAGLGAGAPAWCGGSDSSAREEQWAGLGSGQTAACLLPAPALPRRCQQPVPAGHVRRRHAPGLCGRPRLLPCGPGA